jgi:hypothetical protein
MAVKIFKMVINYDNIFKFQSPPTGIFGLKRNHLATLNGALCVARRKSGDKISEKYKDPDFSLGKLKTNEITNVSMNWRLKMGTE